MFFFNVINLIFNFMIFLLSFFFWGGGVLFQNTHGCFSSGTESLNPESYFTPGVVAKL